MNALIDAMISLLATLSMILALFALIFMIISVQRQDWLPAIFAILAVQMFARFSYWLGNQ